MFFSYVESAEEREARFQGALVVLEDDLFGEIQIFTDYFGGSLLFGFDHK